MTKTNSEAHKEIPPQKKIENFLTEFFKQDKNPLTISEICDVVAEKFDMSVEAQVLKLEVMGRTGHGNNGTFIDSITGFAVMELFKAKTLKRVGLNTYEAADGPDDEVTLTDREIRREVGFVVPSVKILRSIKRFENDPAAVEAELIGADKWSVCAVKAAVKQVFTDPADELLPRVTYTSSPALKLTK